VIHGIAGYVGMKFLLDVEFATYFVIVIATVCAFPAIYAIHRCIEQPTRTPGAKSPGG